MFRLQTRSRPGSGNVLYPDIRKRKNVSIPGDIQMASVNYASITLLPTTYPYATD